MLSSRQLTTSTRRQQSARFTLTECLDCGNIMSVLVFGVLPSPRPRTGKQFAEQTVILVCVFFVPSLAEAPVPATGSARRCYGNKAAWCVPHWARALTRIRHGKTIRRWFAGICRIDALSFLWLFHVGNELGWGLVCLSPPWLEEIEWLCKRWSGVWELMAAAAAFLFFLYVCMHIFKIYLW